MPRPPYAANNVPCLLCTAADAYDETECPESQDGQHITAYDLARR